MRKFYLFFLLLVCYNLVAQEFLVPFKKGEKFGIMDQKGKVVIEPKFKEINWLLDKYFEAIEEIELNDSLKLDLKGNYFVRKGEKLIVKSLIYDGTILLDRKPFDGFLILPDFLINTRYNHDPKKASRTTEEYENYKNQPFHFELYNLKGDNIYPQNFKMLDLLGELYIPGEVTKKPSYALLIAKELDETSGIFIYDAQSGKIKEWLLKNKKEIEILKSDKILRKYSIRYLDENQKLKVCEISVENGIFKLNKCDDQVEVDSAIEENSPRRMLPNEGIQSQNFDEKLKNFGVPKSARYYTKNDTLIYEMENGEKKYLSYQNKIQPVFSSGNKSQTSNLIFKKENKWGVIKKGEIGEAEFDSLIYLGMKNYLGCKKVNKIFKCGTFDLDTKPVIPMIYDSIFPKFPQIDKNKISKGNFHEKNKSETYFTSVSNFFPVYKNGKAGLITKENIIILPTEFEDIFENNLKFYEPKKTQFILAKKSGKYAFINLAYDKEKDEIYLEKPLEFNFTYFPYFLYEDYFGIQGLKIVGLLDEKGVFAGLSDVNGKLFSTK